MDLQAIRDARQRAHEYLERAGIVLTPHEAASIEIAHLGLGELEQTGLQLVTYVNTERVCAKELVLFPRQTCPEHKHPPIDGNEGKEETFRCRWGEVYLYVEGIPVDRARARALPPAHRERYYTVWHEIVLRPGEQYTIPPDTWHWFQGGDQGAVVSEFSTRSRDEFDEFRDPQIRRIAEPEQRHDSASIEGELNIEEPEQLRAYLVRTGRVTHDTPLAVVPLAGGVSARTVLVRHGAGAWVLKQALPRLRVHADWFSDPARIHREAEGLRWLEKLLPAGATARFVFEDCDHHILAMDAVPDPHRNWKELLLNGEVHDAHVRDFARLLARLHAGGEQERDTLAQVFGDRSFFESLRIEPYYAYTASRVPAAADFLNALIEETRALRLSLVHGDYSPKNVLVHDGRLVLLDHEVIHFGDPAFDLGFSLAHLLSKAHHVTAQRTAFERAARLYWDTYCAEIDGASWVDTLEPRAVRHTLACLLARTEGRSPLEYLSPAERTRQREATIALVADTCATVPELIAAFVGRL